MKHKLSQLIFDPELHRRLKTPSLVEALCGPIEPSPIYFRETQGCGARVPTSFELVDGVLLCTPYLRIFGLYINCWIKEAEDGFYVIHFDQDRVMFGILVEDGENWGISHWVTGPEVAFVARQDMKRPKK